MVRSFRPASSPSADARRLAPNYRVDFGLSITGIGIIKPLWIRIHDAMVSYPEIVIGSSKLLGSGWVRGCGGVSEGGRACR